MQRLQLLVLAAVLAGCASANWRNPSITDHAQHKRQFQIDMAECEAYAEGTGPMPMIPPSSPSYRFAGTTSSGTSFSGTAEPRRNFSTGFASGTAIGHNFRAGKIKRNLLKACMYRQGWHDSQ